MCYTIIKQAVPSRTHKALFLASCISQSFLYVYYCCIILFLWKTAVPILYTLNLSDINSNFCTIAMSVIPHWQTIFHTQCTEVFTRYSKTQTGNKKNSMSCHLISYPKKNIPSTQVQYSCISKTCHHASFQDPELSGVSSFQVHKIAYPPCCCYRL